jgi:hypothetical protein
MGITDLEGLIYVATSQRLSSKDVPKGHRVVDINEVVSCSSIHDRHCEPYLNIHV